ncbi:hypothetical protein BDZ91DRAFT_719870 [Kalaharituber pfeilii]|nr:hypothetical protein BDZ91DRAFT_753076 [Kalaharituber pfeilii]KAF8470070.1 hypothetical protein BDZ91DRAFT_719870 [Kalaharituber pfeilii]
MSCTTGPRSCLQVQEYGWHFLFPRMCSVSASLLLSLESVEIAFRFNILAIAAFSSSLSEAAVTKVMPYPPAGGIRPFCPASRVRRSSAVICATLRVPRVFFSCRRLMRCCNAVSC